MTTIAFNSDDPPATYRYTGLGLCPCGHPTLGEDVPPGKLYDAWPESVCPGKMLCMEGCGRTSEVQLIAAARERGNPRSSWGLLPMSGNGVTVLERVP